MIAQKQRPLAVRGDIRRLPQDVGNGKPVLLGYGHVDSGHQGKVIGHVALVAVAEIGADVFRPLIGFREQELAGGVAIQLGPDLLDDRVGFREVLVVGPLALAQIRNGVQPEAVDAEIKPAPHHLNHGREHSGIVVIEVRLMRKEAVPVIGPNLGIPGPIGFLGIVEDDPGFGEAAVGIAPHVPIARVGCRPAPARALEPGMLIGSVVDDELGNHPQLSTLGLLHEAPEILHRPEIRIDVAIVRNVVAIVSAGGWIERQQPERGHAEIFQIVELLGQSGKVPDAVAVAVGKCLDVKLIDDCVLEPELVALELGFGFDVGNDDVHGTTFTHSSGRAGQGPAADRCATARHPIQARGARR